MRVASLFAVVLSFARIAFADDLFIYPTAPGPNNNFVADLLWPVGSTQKIQWSTTISSYYIALFQQHVEASSGQQLQTIYSMGARKQPNRGLADSAFRRLQRWQWAAIFQLGGPDLQFESKLLTYLFPMAQSWGLKQFHLSLFQHHQSGCQLVDYLCIIELPCNQHHCDFNFDDATPNKLSYYPCTSQY